MQRRAKNLLHAGILALSNVLALFAGPALGQQQPPDLSSPAASASIPQAEVPSVGTLADVKPHWVFVNRGNGQDGTRIFDGDSGRMVGMVNMYGQDSFAFDPLGRNFYVAQTQWTKTDRGVRQDMLLAYDVHTLKLTAEIAIPGRMLIGNRTHNLVISDDGKRALIYNMQPSSSVNVVDLEKKKMEEKIELPGCATLLPDPSGGFSALCSNGTLASVAMGDKPVITRSAPFFSATEDPIFDTSVLDPKTGKATFLTYSGLIIPVTLGATPRIGQAWSVQVAAGMRKETYTPMDVNWMPGGREPIAVHNASGRIYLLMHKGEYWSEYAPAEEIWVLDGAGRKLLGRHALPENIAGKAINIAVSQDTEPLVFLSDGSGDTFVLDGASFETKHSIANSGGGILYVMQP
jgi:methylamine dehydrogenase heavy chain